MIDYIQDIKDFVENLNDEEDKLLYALIEAEVILNRDIRNDIYDARVMRQEHPERRLDLLGTLDALANNLDSYKDAIEYLKAHLAEEFLKEHTSPDFLEKYVSKKLGNE